MARKLFAGAGLVRAMENEDDIPNDTPAAEAPPAAESAETELLDVNESAAEGDAEEAATGEAVEAVEALEAYCEGLATAAENGGLDRHGARMMNIGLEQIYSKMGFSQTKAAVSMESFGGSSSRVGATTLAMEDIKDKIKEIWKAIVAAIKRAIAWAKGHFDKIFGAAQNLQKRAKAVQEKAKGINGTPKEKTFENERIVKALHINGAVPASVSSELATVKKVADAVFTHVAEFNQKNGESALEALNADDGNMAKFQIMAPSANAGNAVTDPKALGFSDPHDGLGLVRSVELPGNKAVLQEVPAKAASGEEAAKMLSHVTAYVGAFNPKGKEPTKTTVATLQPTECGKIGAEVEELMTEVINYKAKLAKASELQDKLAKAAEKAGKESTTEEDKDKAKYLSWQQKVTQNTVANVSRAPAGMAAYVLNTSKAALDYAELSLKQYAGK
jgi:hypothetical protein